jgi:hypothetical protein
MKYSNEAVGAIHWPPRRNHVADYWDRVGRHPCRLQAAGLGAAQVDFRTISVQAQLPGASR